MKYLVTAISRRLQVPPIAAVEKSKAWINARVADKTMDFCYGFVNGGGVCIINAESPDQVAQLLMEYPGQMGVDWKVDPLCDINRNFDQVIAMVRRMAG